MVIVFQLLCDCVVTLKDLACRCGWLQSSFQKINVVCICNNTISNTVILVALVNGQEYIGYGPKL